MNRLVLIGFLGGFTAYLNMSIEAAKKQWLLENSNHTEEEFDVNISVRIIDFEDRFHVYDAWE